MFNNFLKCITILCWSVMGLQLNAFGQIYSSKVSCINPDLSSVPPSPSQSTCFPLTQFFDKDTNSVVSIWNFGDGGNAIGRSVNHGFRSPANYSVSVNRTFADGSTLSESMQITVGNYPQQPLFNKKLETDTTVCENNTLKLDPFEGLSPSNISYLWFPGGETTPTIVVDKPGCYSVKVYDQTSKCARSAKINVKICLKDADKPQGGEKWYFGKEGNLGFTLSNGEVKQDSSKQDGELDQTVPGDNPGFGPNQSNPSSKINASEAVAMVYDENVSLVLYTDGKRLFSGIDDSVIPNQDGSDFVLNLPPTSQGLVITPKGNCNTCKYDEYYVYYVKPAEKTLYYAIVDMRYNNKKGAVTEFDIPLLYPVSEKLVGFRSQDDSTYAIFSYNQKRETINAIRISDAGISITESTPMGTGAIPISEDGYMSISHNQRKLAFGYVAGQRNFIAVYNVDPSSLMLLGPNIIDIGIDLPNQIYGVAFSQSTDLLYVTLKGGGTSYLYQIPIANPAGKNLISSSNTDVYGAVMLGPVIEDGNKMIYMSIEDQGYLAFIESPDELGGANTVGLNPRPGSVKKGAEIAGIAKLGLPNVVGAKPNQEGEGLSGNYSGNCQNTPTIFTTEGVCSPLKNEFEWIMPDGTKLSGKMASYTFTKSGWQDIKLKVTVKNPPTVNTGNPALDDLTATKCREVEFNGRIYIKPAPSTGFVDPIYLCIDQFEKKTINADATGGNSFKYRWMTSKDVVLGTNSSYLFEIANKDPKDPLIYKIEVENDFGCKSLREFKVLAGCDPLLFIPDVFTPDGDGINDDFKITIENATDYDLKIYNRWGEVVFESKNPKDKWDGKVKGKIYGNQLYPYVLNYRPKYDIAGDTITKKGTVIVLK